MDDKLELHGRSLRHRFEGPFFRRLMLGGIRLIPLRLKRLTMPFWAGIFYLLLPTARRAIEGNLAALLGPAPFLTAKRRSFQLFCNYAQMISDTYSVHLGLPIDTEVISVGREHLLSVVAKGGVLAMTGHLGMWQLAPFLAEWRGMPTFHLAMAEEPNPLVQSFEQRFRERFKIIYTTGSPFAVLQLAKVLREGGILGLQLDRHIGGQTLALPFCGRTAWFPAGPATLARLTGAPLLASFFVRDDASSRPRIIHYLEPPIYVERTADRDADITAAMTKLVATYERFVRRFPTQWYHFFDFFHQPSGPDLSDAKSSPPQLAAGPALPAGGSR